MPKNNHSGNADHHVAYISTQAKNLYQNPEYKLLHWFGFVAALLVAVFFFPAHYIPEGRLYNYAAGGLIALLIYPLVTFLHHAAPVILYRATPEEGEKLTETKEKSTTLYLEKTEEIDLREVKRLNASIFSWIISEKATIKITKNNGEKRKIKTSICPPKLIRETREIAKLI